MSDNTLTKALELANNLGGNPAEVVARATAYAAFLSGSVVVADTRNAATAKTPIAPAAAAKPAAAAAAAAKPAAAAAKPAAKAAAKAATPAATAPKPAPKGGVHGEADVRKLVKAVANHPKLGTTHAANILDEEAGVANVSAVKPAFYDAVYDALAAKIDEVDGAAGDEDAAADETAGEEFDVNS
jgi:hypothetical protein